jgi:hypothetical protein
VFRITGDPTAFRVALIPGYKAHRANPDGSEEAPEALTAQIPVIEEVLAAAGVAMAAARGYEADDVIGTLAGRADGPVEVVTGDRDLFQLVDDARQVRVIYTARGLSKLDVVDEAWVTAKYGIPAARTRPTRCCAATPAMGCRRGRGGGQDRGRAGPGDRRGQRHDRGAGQGHGGFPAGGRASSRASVTTWRPRCRWSGGRRRAGAGGGRGGCR